METNKYYTPTIEEFHVGFEYQFNDFGTDGNLLSDWQKATIKCGTQIDDINRKEDNKNVYSLRVKLLDREDIESEGFKMLRQEGFLYKERYHLTINETYIHISDNKFSGTMTLFNGIIKNKSELRKLMTQLNIK